ncbi:hypothetical protein PCCS19_44970 [Paenibacillus sp. CCS19]|uniref:nitrite reductase n=1 Tax=Paenibacillus sp. CCS19 TaxID=3158387 RepID=UPI00256A417A|nr:nitrite reductase [Paenibacillus cellulosilyticus]GMK41441.1 hypothetical protein PCCS19_44970 [Paenibacillus cellulosilyticus]
MGMMKIAVTPGFEIGGTLFKPEQLALIGSVIGESARIELTTFKQLYVELEEERLEEVKRKLAAKGLEVYPAGFVTKSLITCNFCRGAEDAGLAIAEKLNDMIAGITTPSPVKIGYAGCALGTSEPLLKDIGVVKMRDTFDIYIGGDPKSLKPAFAELFITGADAEHMMNTVHKLITYFQMNGKNKEKFNKFIRRISIDKLHEVIAN